MYIPTYRQQVQLMQAIRRRADDLGMSVVSLFQFLQLDGVAHTHIMNGHVTSDDMEACYVLCFYAGILEAHPTSLLREPLETVAQWVTVYAEEITKKTSFVADGLALHKSDEPIESFLSKLIIGMAILGFIWPLSSYPSMTSGDVVAMLCLLGIIALAGFPLLKARRYHNNKLAYAAYMQNLQSERAQAAESVEQMEEAS